MYLQFRPGLWKPNELAPASGFQFLSKNGKTCSFGLPAFGFFANAKIGTKKASKIEYWESQLEAKSCLASAFSLKPVQILIPISHFCPKNDETPGFRLPVSCFRLLRSLGFILSHYYYEFSEKWLNLTFTPAGNWLFIWNQDFVGCIWHLLFRMDFNLSCFFFFIFPRRHGLKIEHNWVTVTDGS